MQTIREWKGSREFLGVGESGPHKTRYREATLTMKSNLSITLSSTATIRERMIGLLDYLADKVESGNCQNPGKYCHVTDDVAKYSVLLLVTRLPLPFQLVA